MNIQTSAKKYKKSLVTALKKAIKGERFRSNGEVWIGDISDHIRICNKIIKQKPSFVQLENWLWDLDTDSRDKFPSTFWNYVNSNNER